MKTFLLTLTLLLAAQPAFAVQAFLTGERVTGMTKQCFYEFAGSKYTTTVRSHQLCPRSITVNWP